jgi:hypothetical protein
MYDYADTFGSVRKIIILSKVKEGCLQSIKYIYFCLKLYSVYEL